RITAAVTTGPQSGPRPTSSTPATSCSTSAKSSPSCISGPPRQFEDGLGRLGGSVLAQRMVDLLEAVGLLPAAIDQRRYRLGQRIGRGRVLQQLGHQQAP